MIIQQTQAIDSCSELADFANALSPEIPATLNGLTKQTFPTIADVVKDLDVGKQLRWPSPRVWLSSWCEKNTPELDLPELRKLSKLSLKTPLHISGRFYSGFRDKPPLPIKM